MAPRKIWMLILLVMVGLIVSGCLPDEMPTQVPPTPTFTPQPPAAGDDGGAAAPSEPAPNTDETVPEATPFDLTQLHATDPTSVNLTSGQPTLVEFFAFW